MYIKCRNKFGPQEGANVLNMAVRTAAVTEHCELVSSSTAVAAVKVFQNSDHHLVYCHVQNVWINLF